MEDVKVNDSMEIGKVTSLRNNLNIFLRDEHWCIEIGQPLETNYWSARVSPSSTHLLSLVKSIQELYPQYRVLLDTRISSNPWIMGQLKVANQYGLLPEYEDIQDMLDHPEEKQCNRCKRLAYYNKSVRNWQCSNCRGIELEPGIFEKVRRR